jgi:hypothetical protein
MGTLNAQRSTCQRSAARGGSYQRSKIEAHNDVFPVRRRLNLAGLRRAEAASTAPAGQSWLKPSESSSAPES